MIYNKLVRDNIPAIIKANGKKVNCRTLSQDEFKLAIKAKLVEEVNEFLMAKTQEEMKEELADIKEVLTAITMAFNLVGKGINNVRSKKRIEKGAFSKKYFLESVED